VLADPVHSDADPTPLKEIESLYGLSKPHPQYLGKTMILINLKIENAKFLKLILS
jgi:hypothetical protein